MTTIKATYSVMHVAGRFCAITVVNGLCLSSEWRGSYTEARAELGGLAAACGIELTYFDGEHNLMERSPVAAAEDR